MFFTNEFRKSVLNIIKDVELKDSSKVNLVEIRNPSGSSQWKGRFSDTDSQSWSNVVDPNIRCMKLDRKGRMKNVNDGRSFITFEDWKDQFELLRYAYQVEVARLRSLLMQYFRVCTYDLKVEEPKPLVTVKVINKY